MMGKIVYYDPAVIVFIRDRLHLMPITEIRASAVASFPDKRIPSRSAIGRFAREKSHPIGRSWWTLPPEVDPLPDAMAGATDTSAVERIGQLIAEAALAVLDAELRRRLKREGKRKDLAQHATQG